jgi:hypothetical protein
MFVLYDTGSSWTTESNIVYQYKYGLSLIVNRHLCRSWVSQRPRNDQRIDNTCINYRIVRPLHRNIVPSVHKYDLFLDYQLSYLRRIWVSQWPRNGKGIDNNTRINPRIVRPPHRDIIQSVQAWFLFPQLSTVVPTSKLGLTKAQKWVENWQQHFVQAGVYTVRAATLTSV